jgi:coenzyme F420-0:L-glutamate ligase/coenzyme F420-1:gamma-L-glutamate ligase
MITFTDEQITFLQTQRVGRLATSDAAGRPHVIPVCYAYDGATFYIALDTKPKRVAPQRLKRVHNILENPQVALVIDRYSEDWSELAYLLIRGTAGLLPPGSTAQSRAVALLRDRYPQYQLMPIQEQPVIVIRPSSIVGWGSFCLNNHDPISE